MKTLMITIAVVCAVVAGYFGVRRLMHRDLGFTPAWKYVRNLADYLLNTEITPAREAGTTPETSTGQAA